MTEIASPGTFYVPTDLEGRQLYGDKETPWPLPASETDGTATLPEAITASPAEPFALFSIDGLLEELNDRIFVSETVPGAVAQPRPWGISAGAARLVTETAWTTLAAANFALDCAEHVLDLSQGDTVRLKSGESLGDVIQAARNRLSDAAAEDQGLLGRVSQIAHARRLRRTSDKVADVAFKRTAVDEAADIDILDDPEWAAIAATRDAVLAAVEAVRYQAFPLLVERESTQFEKDLVSFSPESEPEAVVMGLGSFLIGVPGGIVPASVAARDAAERARQAAGDAGGPQAGDAERAWQRDRLAAALT